MMCSQETHRQSWLAALGGALGQALEQRVLGNVLQMREM